MWGKALSGFVLWCWRRAVSHCPNALREEYWTADTSEHIDLISVRRRRALFWINAPRAVFWFTRWRLWFRGRWAFLFASHQMRSVAKPFFATPRRCYSIVLVDPEKARLKDVSETHVLSLIPSPSCIMLCSKLSPGCETWRAVLAVLNQWWGTLYGYWLASINTNIISRRGTTANLPHPCTQAICFLLPRGRGRGGLVWCRNVHEYYSFNYPVNSMNLI